MARTANTPSGPVPFTNFKPDPLLQLDRLLARLSQNILHATVEQERRLRHDEFERTKVRHDVGAARSLLTQTEQSALGIKIHKRRAETQADLAQKRELIEALLERVQVLEDLGKQERWGESEDEDGEDLLAGIVIPTAALVEKSRAPNGEAAWEVGSEDHGAMSPPEETPSKSVSWGIPPAEPAREKAPTTTTAALRARRNQRAPPARAAQQPVDTAQTTSSQSDSTTHRAHLFGQSTDRNGLSAVAAEEAVLDHHRKEQDALTDDILELAREMRKRSEATSKLLEDDKGVMDRVGDALDQTDTNMESAGRGMNVLARMTEGKGYIGRLILWATVAGMAVVLILAFATLPKLRWR